MGKGELFSGSMTYTNNRLDDESYFYFRDLGITHSRSAKANSKTANAKFKPLAAKL